MKFLLIPIFTLIFCCCQPADQKSNKTTPPENKEDQTTNSNDKKDILFFGDSITAGYQLDMSEAFPALIQERLDSLGYEYNTINAGLSGETTASGNSRVEWVLKNRVDIFVLELGANDGLRGISTSSTSQNLQAIIDKVLAKYPECEIVLSGMMIPPNMGQDYTRDFQNIFPNLAKKNNISLIPFLLKGVAGESELNLEDGIHPTPEGHKILMENVWSVLHPLL